MTRQRRSFGRIRRCQPSGRYQASYTGPDGVLHKAPDTFAAKIDAEGWLHERRREIDRNLWSPPAKAEEKKAKRKAEVKFGAYAARWLENRTVKGRPLRPRTREHYQCLLDQHIYPTFSNKSVRGIGMEEVDRWYANVAQDAPTVRAHAYSLLRTILETARKRERLIEVNPCEIHGAGSTVRKIKPKLASLEELDLISHEMPERLRPMVALATWCALRFGELVELRRGDVNLQEGVVSITRAAVRVRGGWEVGPPKSDAGIRDVAIPPHVMPLIETHLDSVFVARSKDALLFPPQGGDGRLQPSTLYRHFYKARAKAQRDDLRWHDLRHTGAVLAAQTGMATLADLMARLGHSTVGAAMRYQHTAQGRDIKIAEAMSKLATA